MWYTDPFIILPAAFSLVALIAFGVMLLMANLKCRVAAVISLVLAGVFTFMASTSYFLSVCINHTEEVNKWIGIL